MIFTTTQTSATPPATARAPRGVLLLIVLSMLTLFMMLGTTYMVVTSRARATARAFARVATAEQAINDDAGSRLVDNAFRVLARGTTNEDCEIPALLRGDDLLGDKYGRTLPGISLRGRYAEIAPVGATDLSGGLLQLQLVAPMTLEPAKVNGRIVTLTLPGICQSRRVLRALGTSGQTTGLVIAAVSPVDGTELRTADINRLVAATASAPNPIHLVLNGREYVGDQTTPPLDTLPYTGDSNEPFDAFSDPTAPTTDPYMASLVGIDASGNEFTPGGYGIDIPAGVDVRKMSFAAIGETPEVDNDADGVLDSKWIDVGFPVSRAADGTFFKARAAYLVLDLDSRLNLNAHGSDFQLKVMENLADSSKALAWPQEGPMLPAGLKDDQFRELPVGAGYGPAEIRLWDLFLGSQSGKPGYLVTGSEIDEVSTVEPDNARGMSEAVLRGDSSGDGPRDISWPTQKRPNSLTGDIYGRNGRPSSPPPGKGGVNEQLSEIREQGRYRDPSKPGGLFSTQIADAWRTDLGDTDLPNDQYASPSDLKGRMKVVADNRPLGDGLVSQMWYVKPEGEWTEDTFKDPYELRLSHKPAYYDTPFLPDELERMLRVYDWDTAQLPTRLSSLLGGRGEQLRLLLTTDSWDTPAIVGETWRKIEDTLISEGFDPNDLPFLLGPELMTGRRLDLTRSIDISDGTGPARRQALCRNLYMLLWLLTDDRSDPDVCRQIAQWAVNVVDFRDPDSTMTTFAFDVDPVNPKGASWDPDPVQNTVIGIERPEVLITQATCWKNDSNEGGVHVVLHRPWAAKALDGENLLPDGKWDPDIRDPDAIDPMLAGVDGTGNLYNALDLGRMEAEDEESPVWRLRVGDDANADVIRFDTDFDAVVFPTLTQHSISDPDATTRHMLPDSWLCVTGDRGTPAGLPVQVASDPVSGNPSIPFVVVDTTSDTALPPGPVPSPSSAPGSNDQVILLERLADPSRAYQPDPSFDNFNPYVEVDRIDDVPVTVRTLQPAPRSGPKQYYKTQTRSVDGPVAGPPSSKVWAQDMTTVTNPLADDTEPYDPAHDAPQNELAKLTLKAGDDRAAWLPWLNRPYVSPVELCLVPSAVVDVDDSVATAQRGRSQLLADSTVLGSTNWLNSLAVAIKLPPDDLARDLFQATVVPSRFCGLATTVANPLIFDGTGTGLEWLAINHLESWREPGRVNLNTVSDARVWDATVRRGGRPATATSPDDLDLTNAAFGLSGLSQDPSVPPSPAETLLDLYGLEAGSTGVFSDPDLPGQETAANSHFQLLTANRLANVATNRSNVFAIWVTVGFFEWNPVTGDWVPDFAGDPKELGSDTGEISRHRGFYIFDRSIPVGYVTGRDLNLDDAIRLRRIIQ